MVLRAGTVLAGYTIERLLGSGGMGAVYLAHHPRLERRVALKVLNESIAAEPRARAAFDREAELAALLHHPNIVPVYDRSGPDDETLWLSMRHIDGGDAVSLLAEEPGGLAAERAVRLVTDAAHALDFAHARGVLHRDVKPANLLVEIDPRHGERALLTDFGIARTLDDTVTMSGIAASLAYTAPERFGDQPADHRADIYSLGCTLFELLTGRTPFPRSSQAAVLAAHLGDPPPAPSHLRPGLPTALDTVIATALAKQPAARYASAADMATAAAIAIAGTAPVEPHSVGLVPHFPSAAEARVDGPGPAAGPPPEDPIGAAVTSRAPRRITRRRLLIGGVAGVALGGAGYLSVLGFDELGSHTAPAAVPDGELSGPTGGVKAIAYSPNHSLLAVGDGDSKTRLWNMPDRSAIEPVLDRAETSFDGVISLAFSPSGSLLAVNSGPGVRIWDARTRQPYGNDYRVSFKLESVEFSGTPAVAFSSEARIATVRYDGVKWWSTTTHQPDGPSLTIEPGAISAFDARATVVAGVGTDNMVRLWYLQTGSTAGKPWNGPAKPITAMVFSPDATLLAMSSKDSVVQLWNVRTGQPQGPPLTGHTDTVAALAFTPDGKTLATGSADSTIRLWDLRTFRAKGSPLAGHIGTVQALAFNWDGTQLASGASLGQSVRLWRLTG